MRGKKSTNIQKRIAGTDQPCRLDADIAVDGFGSLPEPMIDLSATGKKLYYSIWSESYLKRNVINEFTFMSWILGCELLSTYMDFVKKYKSLTARANHPKEYRVAIDAYREAVSLFQQFGFTPIGLTKIASLITKRVRNAYEDYLNE